MAGRPKTKEKNKRAQAHGQDYDYTRDRKRLLNAVEYCLACFEIAVKEEGDTMTPIALMEAAKRCADVAIRMDELKANEDSPGTVASRTLNILVNGSTFDVENADLG
jgi:hypothetical protein